MKRLLLMAALACPMLHAQQARSGPWVMESSGTAAGLRGIHAVGNGSIAWASGTNGTILRTEDAGYLWQRCTTPPDAAKLDFRGIWAWDENTAIAMSSGPGNQSRIYKTTDGCAHWKLVLTNPDKSGFWDSIQFLSEFRGVILGDPVVENSTRPSAASFAIFETFDGVHWKTSANQAPLADPQTVEAFAASNSSLVLSPMASGVRRTWIGTGGKAGAAVYVHFLVEPSCTCSVPFDVRQSVPITGGTASSGVFSLAFRDQTHGVAVGGDYTRPNDSTGTAAWTSDGGQHWTAATKSPHGYRSAVAWDAAAKAWITAGTNGSDISYDNGRTWTLLDNGNWNAVSLPYIVGPNGRIAKLDESKLPKR